MQFEPATFAEYDQPVPPGGADPPSPYDATDAIYAAARLLCANGAAGGADLTDAVYSYNHSASYVAEVLALASAYASGVPSGPTSSPYKPAAPPSPSVDPGSVISIVVAPGATREQRPSAWRRTSTRCTHFPECPLSRDGSRLGVPTRYPSCALTETTTRCRPLMPITR